MNLPYPPPLTSLVGGEVVSRFESRILAISRRCADRGGAPRYAVIESIL